MASSVRGQDEPIPDWLPERVDGAILPARDYPKCPQKPYNKSFIDKAGSVKMADGLVFSFLFCEFMDLNSVSVHKRSIKTMPVSSHFDVTLGQ